eukprot:GHVH01002904.1.p1 GENE.GHVH01002904.1~~GHVH01002904.1.p1  ORF type:complete len:682 (+),score=83.70 GHVH01002904.1:1029-3074(+)
MSRSARSISTLYPDVQVAHLFGDVEPTWQSLVFEMLIIKIRPPSLHTVEIQACMSAVGADDQLQLIRDLVSNLLPSALSLLRSLIGCLLDEIIDSPLKFEIYEMAHPLEMNPTDAKRCIGFLVNAAQEKRVSLKKSVQSKKRSDLKCVPPKLLFGGSVSVVLNRIYWVLCLIRHQMIALVMCSPSASLDSVSRLIITLRMLSLLIVDDLGKDADLMLQIQKGSSSGGTTIRASRIAKNSAMRLLVLIDLQRACNWMFTFMVRYHLGVIQERNADLPSIVDGAPFAYRAAEIHLELLGTRDSFQNLVLTISVTAQTVKINTAYLTAIIEASTKPLRSMISLAPISILSRPRGVIKNASKDLKSLGDAFVHDGFLQKMLFNFGQESQLRCLESVNKVTTGLFDQHLKRSAERWFYRTERMGMAIRKELRRSSEDNEMDLSRLISCNFQEKLSIDESNVPGSSKDVPTLTDSRKSSRSSAIHHYSSIEEQVMLAFAFPSLSSSTTISEHVGYISELLSSIITFPGIRRFVCIKKYHAFDTDADLELGFRNRCKKILFCQFKPLPVDEPVPLNRLESYADPPEYSRLQSVGRFNSVASKEADIPWPSIVQIQNMIDSEVFHVTDPHAYNNVLWSMVMTYNRKHFGIPFCCQLLANLSNTPREWESSEMLPMSWINNDLLTQLVYH